MEKNIRRSYYWFRFLRILPVSFTFAMYVIFLKENSLSDSQVGLVNMVFLLGVALFEMPTGVVADVFSRKTSIMIGLTIEVFSLLIYYFSQSLEGFITAEVIGAVALSFVSGADSAWIKDSLDHAGSPSKSFDRVYSKGEMWDRIAILIGGGVGGVLYLFNQRLPYLVGAAMMLVTIGASFFLIKEDYFVKKTGVTFRQAWQSMKKIFNEGLQYGLKTREIFLLMILALIFNLAGQGINQQWNVATEKYIGLWAISPVWVGIIASIIGGLKILARLIEIKLSRRLIMAVAIFGVGLVTCVMALFPNGLTIFFGLCLHDFFREGFFKPTHEATLQENIPSAQRATIGSFSSMCGKFGAAIGWLGSGIIVDYFSISACWLVSGICFFIAIPFVLKLRKA